MALFGGIALIVPTVIMAKHPDTNFSLVTTAVATVLFALALAFGRKIVQAKMCWLPQLHIARSWWFSLGQAFHLLRRQHLLQMHDVQEFKYSTFMLLLLFWNLTNGSSIFKADSSPRSYHTSRSSAQSRCQYRRTPYHLPRPTILNVSIFLAVKEAVAIYSAPFSFFFFML
jgi:hypothetical protein